MPFHRHFFIAAVSSVALHAMVFAWASDHWFKPSARPALPPVEEKIIFMEVVPLVPDKPLEAPALRTASPPSATSPKPAIKDTPGLQVAAPATDRPRASLDAPPAPTAAEWAFAAQYTLKNSKGYRYSWGQQARSLMGKAVEGVDQGVVRFRVEIAPDGTLARLETRWTTSTATEALARQAIENMPPLPPTPTGKPLVFEKTISFSPFASEGPPIYKNDCLPDPPAFRNPFAWDGTATAAMHSPPVPGKETDAQTFAECLKQLPPDTIEAETAHDQRQLEQWRSGKLGR